MDLVMTCTLFFSHILSQRAMCFIFDQRSRFKAIESLQQQENDDTSNKLVAGTNINTTNTKLPTIVVATDVAARGLDIPSVATVIHYDAARTVDTFVHRSGRTAVRHIYIVLKWHTFVCGLDYMTMMKLCEFGLESLNNKQKQTCR